MTTNVIHSTFTLERDYPAAPERVFAAWSDPAQKARWFVGAGPDAAPMDLDFRVGGLERATGGRADGPVCAYEGCFRDIVPNERIVLTNTMDIDGTRAAVNLVTVLFTPTADGTRVTITDQGTYLRPDLDKPEWRETGTRDQLEALSAELKQ